MDDINEFKKSLIKDLYNLSVNCDITVEELADDICDDCRHFYNQALEDAEKRYGEWSKSEYGKIVDDDVLPIRVLRSLRK